MSTKSTKDTAPASSSAKAVATTKKSATGKAVPKVAVVSPVPAATEEMLPAAVVPAMTAVDAVTAMPEKGKKIRDRFSMPQNEYQKIDALKERCLSQGVKIKKNQLLRAGLLALEKMNTTQLKTALSRILKAEG